MDLKQLLKDQAVLRYDQNFDKVEKYFDHNLNFLISLTFVKSEILNCLILDYNNASITLTNHFLERMLKLSLLQLETKNITLEQPEKYATAINHWHKQYDHIKLHDSIKHNKRKNLISEDEAAYLTSVAKEIRDAYSHAQIGAINKKQENVLDGRMFSISDVKAKLSEGRSDFTSTKLVLPAVSPSIAQLNQNLVSRENALQYFDKIYNIAINIERRLESM